MDCTILRQVAAQKHAHAKRYRRSLLALSRWWVLPLPLSMSRFQQAVHYWVAAAYRTSRNAFWHSRSTADQASWPLGGSPQTDARWAAPCSGQGCVSCLHPAVTPGAHDASPPAYPAYPAYPPHAHRQSLDSASQNLSRELGVEAGSDNDGGGGRGGGGGAAGEFEVRGR